jgi:hypothetical protein
MTKKFLLTMLIALLGIGACNAQFRFGIKAGLNLNKIDFKDVANTFDGSNGTGYTAGVMTEFTIPVIGLGLDASLMYTRMNSAPEININGHAVEGDGEVFGKNYLEIPVNLKYKFSLPVVGNIVSPYLFTGPSFAIKLDKNISEYIKAKTCQVAWNVGLGVELFSHLQVGASYGFGINNVINKYEVLGINAEPIKANNNYWTISAAYLF